MSETDSKRKIPYRIVLLMVLFGFVLVFIVLFSVVSYFNFRRETRENAGKDAEYTVERLVSQVDERFDNLWQYYLKAGTDEAITYALENQIDYQDLDRYLKVQEIFADSKIFGDYINGFTFINFSTNVVISNKGMYKFTEMKNRPFMNELFTINNEKVEKNYWYYDRENAAVSKTSRDYRLTADTYGLNIVMKFPNHTPRVYGMLLVNINEIVWQGWINALLDGDDTIVVTDSNDRLIYASDEEASSILLDTLKDHAIQHKEYIKNSRTDGYVAEYKVSGILDWNYYIMRKVDFTTLSLNGLSIYPILLILLIIIICFSLALYFMYLPVKRLIRSVSAEDEEIYGNELDFLEKRFVQEKHDRKRLEDRVSHNKKKIQELFELRLIRGEVKTEDEWNDYFQGLGIKPCRFYATAVVVLNLKGELDTKDNLSEDAVCLKIVEKLPEDLNRLTWMPLVYNACTMFCIFGENNENTLLDKVSAFHKGMQEFTESYFGLKIIMGVSATHTDYKHIYAAYRESINALTMEDVKNEDECHYFLLTMTERVESFNYSYEKEIKDAVKASDKEQCYYIIDNFHNYLKTLASLDDINYITIRMINGILEAAQSIGLEYDKVFPDGLRTIYREMITAVEPARIRRYLKYALIDPILKARSERMEDDTKVVMEKLEKLIDSTEGEISLTECADKLGVHPTYIWKVLKMERGMAFGEFLESVKLKRAKEMLIRTNMSVNEISERLGFVNPQTFARVFTKDTGFSPSKYRKLY